MIFFLISIVFFSLLFKVHILLLLLIFQPCFEENANRRSFQSWARQTLGSRAERWKEKKPLSRSSNDVTKRRMTSRTPASPHDKHERERETSRPFLLQSMNWQRPSSVSVFLFRLIPPLLGSRLRPATSSNNIPKKSKKD